MFKFEYNIILEVLGFTDKKTRDNHEICYDMIKKVTDIKHIPLEVAQKIYDTYPELRKYISISPSFGDVNPSNIVNKSASYLEIANYYINSKDGLIVLLAELHDYYLRSKDKSDTTYSYVENIEELKSVIFGKIIDHINPYMTTQEWIEKVKAASLDKNINGELTDYLKNETRKLLNDFDKAVNPFMIDSREMLKPIDYLKDVDIHYNSDRSTDIFIRDKESKVTIHYKRADEVLIYSVYLNNGGNDIHFQHTLGKKPYTNDDTEEFTIIRFGEIEPFTPQNIRLNLMDNSITENKQEYTEASQMQIARVNQLLSKAVKAAEAVTIEHMTKPSAFGLTKQHNQ